MLGLPQALALLGQTPSNSEDWAERFYISRTRFFTLNAVAIVVSGFANVYISAASTLPWAGLFVLNVVALATDNRRVHAFVACISAAIVALGIGLPIIQGS